MRSPAAITASLLFAAVVRAQSPDVPATLLAINQIESKAADVLRPALTSRDSRARSAAARVAMVRGFTSLSEDIRATLTAESDATAAREEIRALALLEAKPDLEFLLAQAKRFPPGIDAALAYAVARRGSDAALELFQRRDALRALPDWQPLFRSALWTAPDRTTMVAARIFATGDEKGWSAILDVARQSNVAIDDGVLLVAARSQAEPLRVFTIWYLNHVYASGASTFPERLKSDALAESSDVMTDRESFGRELLRRIAGGSPRENPHWMEWLESKEADDYLESDQELLLRLSDAEFTVREKRCKEIPLQCALPKRTERRIPSQAVLQPDFRLPTLLPAGLDEAALHATGCRQGWMAVGSATVDAAGRVQKLDLQQFGGSPCAAALEMILRLSLADNERIKSPLKSDNLLFVHTGGTAVCLDEEAPGAIANREAPLRAGGNIRAPVVQKRIEPQFPEAVRRSMGPMTSVLVIVESTISKTGCVRNMRLLAQSPYPELNAAALTALSRWQFKPGLLDGEPVDVIFNLTVNFRVSH